MRGERRWDGAEAKSAIFGRDGDVQFDDRGAAATPFHGGMEEEDELSAFGRGGEVPFDAAPRPQVPMDQDMDEEDGLIEVVVDGVPVVPEAVVPLDQDMDEEDELIQVVLEVADVHEVVDEAPGPTDVAPGLAPEIEAPPPADELFEA